MCLISKNKRLRIATKKIECYKVILNWKLFEGLDNPEFEMYETPFKGSFIDRKCICGKKAYKAKGTTEKNKSDDCTIFGRGLIHTYKSMEDVEKFPFSHFFKKCVKVYKCYIMPGTRYVEGVDLSHAKSYASKKIKFVEEVR